MINEYESDYTVLHNLDSLMIKIDSTSKLKPKFFYVNKFLSLIKYVEHINENNYKKEKVLSFFPDINAFL